MVVLVVYPRLLLRQALCALVGGFDGVSTVLSAGTGREGAYIAAVERPAVVLVGGDIPDGTLPETCRLLAENAPRARIVALAAANAGDLVLELLRSGTHACLDHDTGQRDLEVALGIVASGGTFVSPSIVEKLASGTRRTVPGFSDVGDAEPRFTMREDQVLRLAAEGHGNLAIAEELGISVKTVEAHKARINTKLGVRGQVGILKYAIRKGLIDLQPERSIPASDPVA
jgi:DNA-binding NarL/FixJ family response regulator